jgi:hypothetical protein
MIPLKFHVKCFNFFILPLELKVNFERKKYMYQIQCQIKKHKIYIYIYIYIRFKVALRFTSKQAQDALSLLSSPPQDNLTTKFSYSH